MTALFEQLTGYRALEGAYRRARRGHREQPEVVAFHFDHELRLLELERELRARAYVPQPYRYFQVRRPKPRTISVAGFRDRVVHHALVGALEPLFEPHFYRHSYACRRDKGTHRAVQWCRHYARRFPYFLKLDVHKHFDHVDHEVLLGLLAERVDDHGVMWLCRTILAHALVPSSPDARRVGLPIGNLTSQFWGNVVLDPVDRALVAGRRGRLHLRYMDDVVCFGHTKAELWEARALVRGVLESLGLRLKERATVLAPVTEGIPFLGFRVFPGLIRLDRAGLLRYTRQSRAVLARWRRGELEEDAAVRSLAALSDHAAAGDTLRFRRRLIAGPASPGCSPRAGTSRA